MKVDSLALHVTLGSSLVKAEDVEGGFSFFLVLPATQLKFDQISVDDSTVFVHEGTTISRERLKEVLRPFYERVADHDRQQWPIEDQRLWRALASPFREQLWVRVWGELVIEPATPDDVFVEPGSASQGDEDPRYMKYGPWISILLASKIELDIEPRIADSTE